MHEYKGEIPLIRGSKPKRRCTSQLRKRRFRQVELLDEVEAVEKESRSLVRSIYPCGGPQRMGRIPRSDGDGSELLPCADRRKID